MKHAIILDESGHFDWEQGKEAAQNAVHKDGEVNWKAASMADPGVAKCPQCEEFFWAEALKLECTECGTQWNTSTKEIINPF